jgi:putative intracellular protease/amidase
MDIKDFISTEKVQSICQELGIRDWTKLTETKIKLEEAGALYEDRDVVVDGNLVTSRQPADLPVFMRETMKQLGL